MRMFFLLTVLLSFFTTAEAAITTTQPTIYLTATKSLTLSGLVTGGVSPYTFTIKAGSPGTISNGIYTAPASTGTAYIIAKDSSNPQQTLEFPIIMPSMSLRVSSLVMGPGKTKEILIDGGIPDFTVAPTTNFIKLNYNKYTYTSPTTPGNYSFTISDKETSKTVAVTVVPELKTTESVLEMGANSTVNYTTKLTGGKAPYSCAVTGSIITLCNGYQVSVGSTTGEGTITITDDSAQKVTFTVRLAAMSLSMKSLLVIPGETKAISIWGGVSPFTATKTEATISGSTINYIAPQSPVSFTVSDSATNKSSIVVEVVRKLLNQTLNVGQNTTSALSFVGGKAPFTFTKVSGVGTVSSTGSFNSTTTGTAVITVKDSYSPQQTATLTVNVLTPPTLTFSASSGSILPGSSTTLNWSSTGATAITLDGTAVTGTSLIVSPTTTKTYNLKASNPAGSVTKSLTISVATQTTLNGTYIASEYAPNCVPTSFDDYFEKARGHQKRIEPKHCEMINVNHPSFVWRPMSNATYKLIISQIGGTNGYTISKTYPRHVLEANVPNGDYTWKVEYYVNGSLVTTSALRRFTIKSTTTTTFPTPTEFAGRVAWRTERPRSITYGASITVVMNKIPTSELKSGYDSYYAQALGFADDDIPVLTGKTEQQLKQYAMDERRVIEFLGYAWHFTGKTNSIFLSAVKRLATLASLDPKGVTSEVNADQSNREIILALSIGLDLFNDQIVGSDRILITNVIKERFAQMMLAINRLDVEPYMSHTISSVHYGTEALMYLVGLPEFPNAKADLTKMYETYLTVAGSWGGQDGGYSNGTSYSWYSLGTIVRSLTAIKLVTGFDVYQYSPLGNFGLNHIAETIAGAPSRGAFGDELEISNQYDVNAYSTYRLLAQLTRRADYEWYWRVGGVTDTKLKWYPPHPFHYLLLGSYTTLPTAPASVTLPNSFLFEDAGFVAIHNDTKRIDRSSVFFRSSRFGAFNHGHADSNGFTLVSKGQDLLISGGYDEKYMEGHHKYVGRATKFKNALTFDNGVGQSESQIITPQAMTAPVGVYRDVGGKLVNFLEKGEWTIVTGDATFAYQATNADPNLPFELKPLLSAAYRTIAYNRSTGLVLVYDYASSDIARKWELNFHSLVKPTNAVYSNGMRIDNGVGSACVDVIAPSGNMNYYTNFPVNPIDRVKYPDQHHYQYAVTTATTTFASVTIIREGCSTPAPSKTQNGTSFTVKTSDGKIIVMDKKEVKFYE